MRLWYDDEGDGARTREKNLPICGPEELCAWPAGADKRRRMAARMDSLEAGGMLGKVPLTRGEFSGLLWEVGRLWWSLNSLWNARASVAVVKEMGWVGFDRSRPHRGSWWQGKVERRSWDCGGMGARSWEVSEVVKVKVMVSG